MSYERQNGHNGGVPDQGLGATTGLKLTSVPPKLPPAAVIPLPGSSASSGSPIRTMLLLGGLGLGGYLLYRHFKKKGGGGSAPESAP